MASIIISVTMFLQNHDTLSDPFLDEDSGSTLVEGIRRLGLPLCAGVLGGGDGEGHSVSFS
jgi:hypothetical protein